MQAKIISVSGYARSGKDTIANYFQLHGFKRYGYADKLKELAIALGLWRGVDSDKAKYFHNGVFEKFARFFIWAFYGPFSKSSFPRLFTTYRDNLVALGKGVRDILGADVWVNAVWQDEKILENAKRFGVCVADTRYRNEVDIPRIAAADNGLEYLLIWVERPGTEPQGEELEKTLPLREIADAIIVNDGSIEDLYQKLANL